MKKLLFPFLMVIQPSLSQQKIWDETEQKKWNVYSLETLCTGCSSRESIKKRNDVG